MTGSFDLEYWYLLGVKMNLSHTQAFSQKGIQVSCGCPILGENDAKCTKALTNLWRDMPPGRPLFKFWLKAWPHPQNKIMVHAPFRGSFQNVQQLPLSLLYGSPPSPPSGKKCHAK